MGEMSNFLSCLPTFTMPPLTAVIAVLVVKRKNMHIKHAYHFKQKKRFLAAYCTVHMSESLVTDAALRREE